MNHSAASGGQVKSIDLVKVQAILTEAQEKLASVGMRSLLTSSVLPGSGTVIVIFVAPNALDLQAALVSLENGKTEAFCDPKAFSVKVQFSLEESAMLGGQSESGHALNGISTTESLKAKNHGAKWTQENDEELARSWNAGAREGTLHKIAEKMARSEVSIAARLVKIGIVETREQAREISARRVVAPVK
ncbi:MAG TPA: hypothetical protein VK832_15935 [Burkholderiaceae bacterium]|jgi:hypothetical protein|nr:hypothetical protein [Burkholderiaceae bacterium]